MLKSNINSKEYLKYLRIPEIGTKCKILQQNKVKY